MQNMNLDLDSHGCLLSTTHADMILEMIEIEFPCGHFWDISILLVEEIEKKWKSIKSGDWEIQFKQFIVFAKIFSKCILDRRHPNLDSYFAFNFCYVCGNALKLSKKIAK